MKIILLSLVLFVCWPLIHTKLSIKEINKQFSEEDCIEGDIEVEDGYIVDFISGQSSQRNKKRNKHDNKVIGAFFPDAPVKSPVSTLGELAKLNKLTDPFYHLEKKEGPDHQPTFTVLLLLSGREFRAQGGSIKKAKSAAAQAALDSGVIPVDSLQTKVKSPGKRQEEQTPITQLNNIALKLKMKVEYIREKYQPEVETYGGSHKGFANLGKRKSYEERLNASIYKTAKKGPDPDIEETKGPFTYLVKVGHKLEFRANGRTKQGAKQNAAERALDAFKQMDLKDAIDCLRDGKECNAENVKSPISILQEMAQYRQFPITYTLISESGLPHKKTFEILCEILEGKDKLLADGEGSSKKEAKKNAAVKMLDKLSSLLMSRGENMKIESSKRKNKKKKSKINHSELNLAKEEATNKIMSVYEYFTTEDDKENLKNEKGSSKQPENSNDRKTITDEDFESFDDSEDYKRRLRSILDDYNLKETYLELDEGHRKVVLLIVPTNPKLICIAEAVDIPSAKDLVSYFGLKWILNNSDFQFKYMYHDNDLPGIKEENVFMYSDVNEKTD